MLQAELKCFTGDNHQRKLLETQIEALQREMNSAYGRYMDAPWTEKKSNAYKQYKHYEKLSKAVQ